MKVLVTGSAGQLGYDVIRTLENRGIPCRGVDKEDFDLTDADAVMDYICEYAPSVIVHCAAYTAVDRAESEPERCAAVNGDGTMNMVRAALSVGAKMVYISTDYVFPGTGSEPWKEAAELLKKRGYDKWVLVEHDTHLREPATDLKISLDALKEIFC